MVGDGSIGYNPTKTVCLCLKPFSGCRLWPIASNGSHIVRSGQASGPQDMTKTLLGNLSQFCATFFHANSWEVRLICRYVDKKMRAHDSCFLAL